MLGLQATPLAGDQFVVVESEARAREIDARMGIKPDTSTSAVSATAVRR